MSTTTPTASRRIFLSHAAYDTLTAKVMKDVLARAGVGETFLDADDLRPGDHWLPSIRTAIAECDAIITLLTPEFASRPWMSAEWACFWATNKSTYVLRLDVEREQLFQPMQAAQVADITSVSSMTAFLDTVAEDNVNNHHLAQTLVERVARARAEQAAAQTERMLQELVTRSAVPERLVKDLIAAGHVEELANLHLRVDEPGSNITPVRLYNVARFLVEAKVAPERLLPLAQSIENSNYQRNIIISVLGSAEFDEAQRGAFGDALFDYLSIVAKQRVVNAAQGLGFTLSDMWNTVPPFGT